TYGIIVFNNALPIVGNSTYGGYNNIINSNTNLLNTTSGYVYAQNNWWGSSNPANFLISGGPVSYSPYRTSSVNVPQPALSKINGGNPEEPVKEKEVPMVAELDKAYSLAYSGNIEEARAICLNLVNDYPDYAVSYNALNLLKETYTENELTSKENAYKSIFNSKSKKDLYALAGLMLADLDKENKLKQIDEVIENYKGESIVELALFDKLVYYTFELQDIEKAREISDELDKQFPNSQGAIEGHKILGDEKYFGKNAMQKDNSQIVKETPAEFGLFDNYPNPFNPTTIIKYQLPMSSMVNLKVFNILGQEVATLVNETQEAGKHEVRFTANNLSSGVYFVNISAGSFNQVKKIMLAK
ncbi:MAG: T9SS type A sorting domain-containing protein, partial [Ignavibacteria bacterium]|nr:T9SS type A sorting domain-containing protein [Ignavibacteria bacterium]